LTPVSTLAVAGPGFGRDYVLSRHTKAPPETQDALDGEYSGSTQAFSPERISQVLCPEARFRRSMVEKRMVKKTMIAVNTNTISVKFEPGFKYANGRFKIPARARGPLTKVRFSSFLNDFQPLSLCIN